MQGAHALQSRIPHVPTHGVRPQQAPPGGGVIVGPTQ
jgi:hypothetical protein